MKDEETGEPTYPIDAEIIARLNERAGREHSANGTVFATLSELLLIHDGMVRDCCYVLEQAARAAEGTRREVRDE